jgi:hypothetical protein
VGKEESDNDGEHALCVHEEEKRGDLVSIRSGTLAGKVGWAAGKGKKMGWAGRFG